mmetsp:Transcript_3957/g.4472  ORF Transcript_3957/g.4472 Transcript_3957/m.4472 type:complete len:113 (+) Transcript_3957:1-339(+)
MFFCTDKPTTGIPTGPTVPAPVVCTDMTTWETCTDPKCYWDTSSLVGFCTDKKCMGTTSVTCTMEPGCTWSGTACTGAPPATKCSDSSLPDDCSLDWQCKWDAIEFLCVDRL